MAPLNPASRADFLMPRGHSYMRVETIFSERQICEAALFSVHFLMPHRALLPLFLEMHSGTFMLQFHNRTLFTSSIQQEHRQYLPEQALPVIRETGGARFLRRSAIPPTCSQTCQATYI